MGFDDLNWGLTNQRDAINDDDNAVIAVQPTNDGPHGFGGLLSGFPGGEVGFGLGIAHRSGV